MNTKYKNMKGGTDMKQKQTTELMKSVMDEQKTDDINAKLHIVASGCVHEQIWDLATLGIMPT